eukprot:763101-Prymnesium_polylepis.1
MTRDAAMSGGKADRQRREVPAKVRGLASSTRGADPQPTKSDRSSRGCPTGQHRRAALIRCGH